MSLLGRSIFYDDRTLLLSLYKRQPPTPEYTLIPRLYVSARRPKNPRLVRSSFRFRCRDVRLFSQATNSLQFSVLTNESKPAPSSNEARLPVPRSSVIRVHQQGFDPIRILADSRSQGESYPCWPVARGSVRVLHRLLKIAEENLYRLLPATDPMGQ
jgi:hypothetical protein